MILIPIFVYSPSTSSGYTGGSGKHRHQSPHSNGSKSNKKGKQQQQQMQSSNQFDSDYYGQSHGGGGSGSDGERPSSFLPGPMIRARLPNEQRTTVHLRSGQTVREALEKAMSRRQLNSQYCYVEIVDTW